MGQYLYIIFGLIALVLLLVAFLAPKPKNAPTPASNQPKPSPDPTGNPDSANAKAERVSTVGGGKSSTPLVEVSKLPSIVEDKIGDEPTKLNPRILVMAVGRTDPGLKRKHNEDAYLVLEDHQVFLVADGMGRHAAGEVASQLAVDTVAAAFATSDFGNFPSDHLTSKQERRINGAILLANKAIVDKTEEVHEYHGMGTTVVALHFSQDKSRVVVAHVGDSRCYRIRKNVIEQLTTDHTLGAVGIKGPSANFLSKAVGLEPNLDVDLFTDQPEIDDLYVICSDGLSRMVPDEKILETCMADPDLDTNCTRLIEEANKSGGRDNVTVILVRVQDAVK
jgi:serine/threonine protein phosphatase PrpC